MTMIRTLLAIVLFWTIPYVHAESELEHTEELAERAAKTLKHLGLFLQGELTAEELQGDVSSNFRLMAGGGFQSNEGVGSGGFTLERKGDVESFPIKDLAKWRASMGVKVLRTKFKLVRVIPNPKDSKLFQTEQLFEGLAQTAHGRREIHQYWKAEWMLDGRKVLLRSLQEERREQSIIQGQKTVFADQTSQVLRIENSDLGKALSGGANYWMQRLESAIHPDFFGENGVSVADVNGDGRDDVYVPQLAGIPNQLFLCRDDGSYEEAAGEHGLNILENTTCALFVDLDNDGDQDVVLGTASGLTMMQNTGGGKFKLLYIMESAPFVFGVCAADYDGDGDLDLYASQYYASNATADGRSIRGNFPVPYPIFDANNGGRNVLLRNTGNLKFEDVTRQSGLDENNSRYSYASLWEDWDNDGDQDLYVVNDFGRNNYYQNEDGKFRDASDDVGLTTKAFGMGVTSGDYNGDGWLDIHVSNMFSSAGSRITRQQGFKPGVSKEVKSIFQLLARGNALMMNREGSFTDKSEDAGITIGRWSWGCLSPDLNNDGYEDLLIANGFVTGKEPDDL